MPTKIRSATLSDISGIAEVQVKSWQTIYRSIVPDTYLDSLSIKAQDEKWHTWIKAGAEVLVADNNNSVVGFISFCSPRESRLEDVKSQPVIEINTMYIAPDKWRQGIGTLLYNEAEIEFNKRSIQKIILWVLEKNAQGRKFY